MRRQPRAPQPRGAGRGFTLVEIMVALAIGMVILLALTIMFSRNTGNQAELERSTRQLENARYSINFMAEDVMHAGYFGEFNPDTLASAPAYQTPDPCALPVAQQGWNTGVTPVQIPLPVQGIAAGTAVACLASRVAGTEAIVVRHAETGAAATLAGATNGNLYLQISRCDKDPDPGIRAAPGGSNTFNLRLPDCDPTFAVKNDSLRRLLQRTYFIAGCNDCAGGGDGVPTLKRMEMIDGALRTMSVAEGVENLQVEYGVDTDGDGVPDTFSTIGGIAAAQWPNVVSVRLHLLTRSTQPTAGFTDARTYRVGPDVSVAAPADGNKRTLLATTVRLHNVGGRRE